MTLSLHKKIYIFIVHMVKYMWTVTMQCNAMQCLKCVHISLFYIYLLRHESVSKLRKFYTFYAGINREPWYGAIQLFNYCCHFVINKVKKEE